MKNLVTLFLVFNAALWLGADSYAKTKVDCCASGEDVYEPSPLRIKITNSPELAKQLASLKSKPAELAKMRKAIGVGNKLIQGHINKDLYQYGWDPLPYGLHNELLEEGWKKHFEAFVAAPLQEFRAFVTKRGKDEGLRDGQYVASPRYMHLVCPYSQLDNIQVNNDKLYLIYRFVHIARPNTSASHMLDQSSLDTSKNGKVQILRIVINNEFKFLPFESIDRNWWSTWPWDVKRYKRELRFREQSDFGSEKNKPNLRKLLAQITEAEKVCNKPNPFQQ